MRTFKEKTEANWSEIDRILRECGERAIAEAITAAFIEMITEQEKENNDV